MPADRFAARLHRIVDSGRAEHERFPEEPDEFWDQAEAWGGEWADAPC